MVHLYIKNPKSDISPVDSILKSKRIENSYTKAMTLLCSGLLHYHTISVLAVLEQSWQNVLLYFVVVLK